MINKFLEVLGIFTIMLIVVACVTAIVNVADRLKPDTFSRCVDVVNTRFDVASITPENANMLLQIIEKCDDMNN